MASKFLLTFLSYIPISERRWRKLYNLEEKVEQIIEYLAEILYTYFTYFISTHNLIVIVIFLFIQMKKYNLKNF